MCTKIRDLITHTHLNTHTSARRLLLRAYHMRGFNSSHFVPPPPPFPPPQEEEEEEEEKPQVVLRSVCPNCQHATTKTISTTTQRRRQRRREEEEDDEDDEEDGDNNEGCPLQLCEKCKYIFLTKGHEENADPEAPIKSLLLSEGEKEEECKGKKIHANRMLFFACGNCEAMLSLPELVARDCVVEESKLVVCGACEELTIMGGFSNSSRLAASGGGCE